MEIDSVARIFNTTTHILFHRALDRTCSPESVDAQFEEYIYMYKIPPEVREYANKLIKGEICYVRNDNKAILMA